MGWLRPGPRPLCPPARASWAFSHRFPSPLAPRRSPTPFFMASLLCCGPKLAACGIVLSAWGVIINPPTATSRRNDMKKCRFSLPSSALSRDDDASREDDNLGSWERWLGHYSHPCLDHLSQCHHLTPCSRWLSPNPEWPPEHIQPLRASQLQLFHRCRPLPPPRRLLFLPSSAQ
uniref:Ribonuclease kappa isoform 5 n=1 Tax=Homo sapiens TaxID=9606 RepID=A0A3S6CYT1_HUMAN|nr:ribonuclease kappa isoform 5 [Homo sapiens]